jgi:hypothetical protein
MAEWRLALSLARPSLWSRRVAAFRSEIAAWLREGPPHGGEELVSIGPSTGHCLPIEQLAAFRVARRLLARKIRRVRPGAVSRAETRG